MRKNVKLVTCALAGIFGIAAIGAAGGFVQTSASVHVTANAETVTPYGLYANVSIKVAISKTYIKAIAKNEFTLFSSTVNTYVELYSSPTWTEDISQMTLEAQNYIYDLDQGNELSVTADYNGRELFWRARVRYNRDNSDWEIKETNTHHLAPDGTMLH